VKYNVVLTKLPRKCTGWTLKADIYWISYRFVVQALDFARQVRRFAFQRRHVPGRFRIELRSNELVGIRFQSVDVTPAAVIATVLVAATFTLIRTPCNKSYGNKFDTLCRNETNKRNENVIKVNSEIYHSFKNQTDADIKQSTHLIMIFTDNLSPVDLKNTSKR